MQLPSPQSEPQRVMIVAGEASGDLHGARLVEALRTLAPDLRFCGMGGRHLAGQGVEILVDMARVSVVGIFEVLGHLREIWDGFQVLSRKLAEKPDLLVLVDFPDFNLLLASKAQRLGVPVLYYISPQVWAWRSGRARKIARLSRRIAVILPFEQDFYRKFGVEVDFVGHPLLDSVSAPIGRIAIRQRLGVPDATPLVCLLPGSRRKEIASMLPVFLEAAEALARQDEAVRFVLPLAQSIDDGMLDAAGLAVCAIRSSIIVVREEHYSVMAACDAALTASGTVTLELAILGVPMVVAYRLSPLTYELGRRLVKLPFFSLVNLVAGKKVVPECLQEGATGPLLAAALAPLVFNAEIQQSVRAALHEVLLRLGEPGASVRTAKLALDIMTETV